MKHTLFLVLTAFFVLSLSSCNHVAADQDVKALAEKNAKMLMDVLTADDQTRIQMSVDSLILALKGDDSHQIKVAMDKLKKDVKGDSLKIAVDADEEAFAALGITPVKNPDLVTLYNESYEKIVSERGYTRDSVYWILIGKKLIRPSKETVTAVAGKNAEEIQTAFATKDPNFKTVLGALADVFSTLNISEEKTPELVETYIETFESSFQDKTIVKEICQSMEKEGLLEATKLEMQKAWDAKNI